MEWDWRIDAFKILIAGTIGWGGKVIVKKFKPTVASLRKLGKIDELVTDVEIIKSKQIAGFQIDSDPIFITDPEGKITYINTAYMQMVGFSDLKEAHGFGYMRAIPDEDKEMMEQRGELLEEHPAPFRGAVRFQNVNTGVIINTICKMDLVYDKDRFIGTIGKLVIVKTAP